MVGGDAEKGSGGDFAQFRNVAGVAVEDSPSDTGRSGSAGNLGQGGTTDRLKDDGVRAVVVGRLDGFEDLGALGDGVIIGIEDLDFRAQIAGHQLGGLGLFDLVIVVVGGKRNENAQLFHGGSSGPPWAEG